MKINEAGLALLKQFEGCKLKAYPDPGTGGDPWTIGYGHTGPEVCKGMVISQDEAEVYLLEDIERFETEVSNKVCVDLNPNQFSALVCFAYNVGGWTQSTLLKLINHGDFKHAADEFVKWNHAGGKVLPGLTRRRIAERFLFCS